MAGNIPEFEDRIPSGAPILVLKYPVLLCCTGPMSLAKFLDDIRESATETNYRSGIAYVLGTDPDGFLELARKEPLKAEEQLVLFIKRERERIVERKQDVLSPASIINPVMAVRSFLDTFDVKLNWKRIRKILPPAKRIADDRAPTVEEVRKLLNVCGLRERVIVHVMLSGMRVGGFYYPKSKTQKSPMLIQDLEFLPNGLIRVTVYRNTPAQYFTFLTPEGTQAVQDYLAARRKVGEAVGPSSPLIRDKWAFEGNYPKRVKMTLTPERAYPLTDKTVKNLMLKLWVKAGVREWGIHRGEFQADHGFRKFFESNFPNCPEHGERDKEYLMGHKVNYYRPVQEHLVGLYLQALPHLMIDESHRLKEEARKKEAEHESVWSRTRVEVLELKEENRSLKDVLKKADQRFERIERMLDDDQEARGRD